MAQARRELKTRQSLGSKMSHEQELEEADRLAEVMKAERAKEKEAQAKQVGSVGGAGKARGQHGCDRPRQVRSLCHNTSLIDRSGYHAPPCRPR